MSDRPSDAWPARCPTCGSDDPKVRGYRWAGMVGPPIRECSDPWHGGGVLLGDSTEGSENG